MLMIAERKTLGVEVIAIEQPFDSDVPESKMMQAIFFTIPEIENDRRSLNTRNRMRRAQREGRFVSHAPKGYRRVPDGKGKSILATNDDARFVRRACEEVALGVKPCAEVLRSRDIDSRTTFSVRRMNTPSALNISNASTQVCSDTLDSECRSWPLLATSSRARRSR